MTQKKQIEERIAKEKQIEERIAKVKVNGYYQPKDDVDFLCTFEVYESFENCQADFPDDEIIKYYGDDIEDFTIVD